MNDYILALSSQDITEILGMCNYKLVNPNGKYFTLERDKNGQFSVVCYCTELEKPKNNAEFEFYKKILEKGKKMGKLGFMVACLAVDCFMTQFHSKDKKAEQKVPYVRKVRFTDFYVEELRDKKHNSQNLFERQINKVFYLYMVEKFGLGYKQSFEQDEKECLQ